MKFGKHKNQPVKSLPTNYIEWFCGNVPGHDDIKAEMQRVLLARWDGLKPKRDEKPKSSPKRTETQVVMFPVAELPTITLVPWDGISAPF